MSLKDFFRKYRRKSQKGFTVIEVLAVVIILAIASTATVSIFLAVRNTLADTTTITTDQFSVTQVEKFIRNELQVATKVDISQLDATYKPTVPSYTIAENDEVMRFNVPSGADTGSIYFNKAVKVAGSTDPQYRTVMTIDNVKTVTIKICPVNYSDALAYTASGDPTASNPTTGQKLKFIYEIEATDYTYSGGIVLGNSKAGEDMSWYDDGDPDTPQYSATIVWDAENPSLADNDLAVFFHSEVAFESSTAGTSST